MKKLGIAFALLLLFVAPSSAEVLKIVIDDAIHPITEEFVQRAIDEAQSSNATALLIQINTPGGLSDSTRKIVESILASKVPVIVYVGPSGSRAASAGFFILQAADIAAMAPGTNTGAAHPVIPGVEIEKTMNTKLENDAAAFMRSYVSKRGRNVELAESAVRESKSWTEQECLKENLIEYIASSEADLLKQIDGKVISRFDGTKTKIATTGQSIRTLEMTTRQRVMTYLLDPNVAYILLAIGMMAIYAEFNHPGAIFPGATGALCLLLAGFALNLLPLRFGAIILIIAAFVFFALEAKFTSYGILGTAGVICLVVGGLMLVDGPIPEMRVNIWTALGVAVPLGIISVLLMTLALRAHQNKIVTGVQGLVGEIGVARTVLAPAGQVFVHGEIWNAVAPAEVPLGAQVRVKAVRDLTLDVEPVGSATSTET